MSPEKRHKGGKLLPALCNLLGTLMLLAIIVGCSLVIVPQINGYSVFHVVSGSMAPEIPIGSLVYVKPIEPEVVQTGDIIAFQSGESVITHRVVTNHLIEREFTTKGDVNADDATERVDYRKLIGIVAYHYANLGELLMIFSTAIGKLYIVLFAACGAMLNVLASHLRARHRDWGDAAEERVTDDSPEQPAD